MVDYNLDCSNIGIQPTYTGGMGSSLIDATLISNDKSNLIKNWKLDPEYSFSDHRMITFQIGIKKPEVEHILDTENLDKEGYRKEVEEKAELLLKTIPKTWNAIILTKRLSNFNKILQEAAENNCKMRTKRVARDPNPWRTDEIKD